MVRPLGSFLSLILKSPSIPLFQRGRMMGSPLYQRGVRGDFSKIIAQLGY